MTDADPMRNLLAAVREALDLPLPGITDADERKHAALLTTRAARARIALEGVLDDDHDPAREAAWLREVTAETPITYTPWTPPAEQDGGAS